MVGGGLRSTSAAPLVYLRIYSYSLMQECFGQHTHTHTQREFSSCMFWKDLLHSLQRNTDYGHTCNTSTT